MKTIEKIISVIGIVGSIYLNNCAPSSPNDINNQQQNQKFLTNAQKEVIAGKTIEYFAKDPNLKIAARLLYENGLMKHDLEVAETGKTNININNNTGYPNNPSRKNTSNNVLTDEQYLICKEKNVNYIGNGLYVPIKNYTWGDTKNREPRFYIDILDGFSNKEDLIRFSKIIEKNPPVGISTYNKYIDLDTTRILKEEFFGLGKTKFNLNEEDFGFLFLSYDVDTNKSINAKIYDNKGNFIWQSEHIKPSYKWFTMGFQTSDEEGKSLLDSLKNSGSGKKQIFVIDTHGQIHKKEFEIITQ